MAEEKAKKVVIEAETKSVEIISEAKKDAKEKEEKFKATEDRLIKKDSLLDQRQIDLDKEKENLKLKIVEIKDLKEKMEKLADSFSEDKDKNVFDGFYERIRKLSKKIKKKYKSIQQFIKRRSE